MKIAQGNLDLSFRNFLLVVLALAAGIYLVGLGHGLTQAADAREAEIAREMYQSGDWAVPTLNGEVFLEKPPLFFATVALSFKIFGVSELAARLPCSLFAIAGIVGAALIGVRLKDQRLGLIMALILMTTIYYLGRGHEVYLDVALTAFVIWSLLAFLEAYLPSPSKPRTAWLAAGYALMTAAFMTKGIVGALVPGLTLAAFLALQRDWRGLWRIKPWLGIIIFAVLAAPWHYALYRQGGDAYFKIFYLDNHYYRFFPASDQAVNLGHHAPWHWYLTKIWEDYLPWCLLFPPAFIAWARKDFRQWLGRPALAFIIAWLVPAFLFFTVSSTKRSAYLLPLYAGYAAAIGAWLAWKLDEKVVPRADRLYLFGFAAVMAALALGLPIYALQRGVPNSWALFVILWLPAAGAGAYTIWGMVKNSPARAIAGLLASAYFMAAFFNVVMLPQDRREDDHSQPARIIAEMTKDAPALYCLGNSEVERSFLGFYGERRIIYLGRENEMVPAVNPERLPPAGERFPVASVARMSDLIEARRQALVDAGFNVEQTFRDDNGKHISVLWWVTQPQPPRMDPLENK